MGQYKAHEEREYMGKIKNIQDLKQDTHNANKGTAIGQTMVDQSIERYGAGRSVVVDKNGNIIGGNKTVKAAQEAGLDIEVVKTSGDKLIVHQREDLDLYEGDDARMLAYVDNRSSELGLEWDADVLADDIAKGLDLGDMFSEKELDAIGVELPTEEVDEPEAQIDAAEELQKKWKVKDGDIWQIGEHRLMCGDNIEYEKIVKGKVDMVFTDPPYNINYQGVSDKKDKIRNDKMPDRDFVEFLCNSLSINNGCDTFYVCCSWQYSHLFREAMDLIGSPVKSFIVWDKVNPAQNLDKYYKQHEIILYSGDFGGQKTIRGDVWEVKRQRNTHHPTMKPVELISMAIKDNPDKTNIYDPFLGSGSTMVAAEQLGRKCYGMEIEPKYCAVILERMSDMGLTPELIENVREA